MKGKENQLEWEAILEGNALSYSDQRESASGVASHESRLGIDYFLVTFLNVGVYISVPLSESTYTCKVQIGIHPCVNFPFFTRLIA